MENGRRSIIHRILDFIKQRKGGCLVAAALVLFIVIFLANSNIETVKQHEERLRREDEERQAALQGSDGTLLGSKAGLQELQGILSKDSIVFSLALQWAREAQAGNVLAKGIQNYQAQIGNRGSLELAQANGENAASHQGGSQDALGDMGNQNALNGQWAAGSQDAAGSRNGAGTPPTAAGTGQGAGMGQGAPGTPSVQDISGMQHGQGVGEAQSGQDGIGNSDGQGTTQQPDQGEIPAATAATTKSPQAEQAYITVTVKIICEKVIGHPDLSTSAELPDDGVIVSARTAVKKDGTVLEALEAVCRDYGIAYVNKGSAASAYISSIGGLAEKECGRYSGWKYKLNGVASSKACSSQKLQENDEILWYYATTYTE